MKLQVDEMETFPLFLRPQNWPPKNLDGTAKRDLNSMVKSAWNWEKNYRKND